MTPTEIKAFCRRIEPVGSRVTCSPAPTDTDEDYLILADLSGLRAIREAMPSFDLLVDRYAGNRIDREEDMNGFEAFRDGDYNYIVTQNAKFFNKFMAASSVAKRLNLLDKADRVALFQAVLYGNPCA